MGEPGHGWITMGGGLDGEGFGVAKDGNIGRCTVSVAQLLLLIEDTTRVVTVELFMCSFCVVVEAFLF